MLESDTGDMPAQFAKFGQGAFYEAPSSSVGPDPWQIVVTRSSLDLKNCDSPSMSGFTASIHFVKLATLSSPGVFILHRLKTRSRSRSIQLADSLATKLLSNANRTLEVLIRKYSSTIHIGVVFP